ncbi:MAG: Ppx/GppA phosphatase family protein [Candidatus Neomarinimicrobiota bacterium]
MRLASLDLGTNALLLTIADWEGTSLNPVYEDATLIRLGQDLKRGGLLHPDAKERCLDALSTYSVIVSRHKVEKTIAVATEALRRASDGGKFLNDIREKWGISFRIIPPKEEARTTFKATQKEFAYLDRNLLMFDIGGGSTEIVYGDTGKIHSMTSLDIGTVTVTEQFIRHDPIPSAELEVADKFVREILAPVSQETRDLAGVGIAGTITTLKAVTLEMETYDHAIVHRSTLTRAQIDDLLKLFTSMTVEERLVLKGLPEMRADIIPAGVLITQAIMDAYGLSEIYVSDRGLRWGLLYSWID